MKKRNILSCAGFMLGLIVLLVFTSLLFQPKNNTEKYGMEEQRANGILGEAEQTIDVLFLGDSITYCSVVPIQIWRDYGITSYVCATPLQRLYYAREFLYKTFERQSPKVVMLGTSSVFQEFTYDESVTNRIECALPIFRYHDRWKKLKDLPEWESGLDVEYTNQEYTKGYYFSMASEVVNPGDYTRYTDVVEWVPDTSKEVLIEIKEFCDKNNAKLILLSEPNVTGGWGPHRHNGIVMLAMELGIEYVDLNYKQEEVPIDWSKDSFDAGDHLNYHGAQKVTAYLGQYLAGMEIFQDKRSDVRYESWNEAQKTFYERVSN